VSHYYTFLILSIFYFPKFLFPQKSPLFYIDSIPPVRIEMGTYLGSLQRNYYGDSSPSKLGILWKIKLGSGSTVISKKEGKRIWSGCGWTGQPLAVREGRELFLLQGAFDHHLKKINAKTGEIVWQYGFDDVIKGTGTIWMNWQANTLDEQILVIQGSRRGVENSLYAKHVPSLRAVSYFSGLEQWRLDVRKTPSYSRDVDGSALILQDTIFIGLENAVFMVLDPHVIEKKNDMMQPRVIQELPLYDKSDIRKHGGNLVVESSPSLLRDHIYITAGSGHVYGYNLKSKKIDWDFYIGSDLDGSPIVTADSCLLVTVEKQYIKGSGGLLKLDPSKKPEDAVVWFLPTENKKFVSWEGGIIGSACVNDRTRYPGYPPLSAVIGIDGYLYIIAYQEIDTLQQKVSVPNQKKKYPQPKIVFKTKIGPSISTPIMVGDKLIAAGYGGIFLFQYDENARFKLLDSNRKMRFESTPIALDRKIFIGSRNGYLYCFGEKVQKKKKMFTDRKIENEKR